MTKRKAKQAESEPKHIGIPYWSVGGACEERSWVICGNGLKGTSVPSYYDATCEDCKDIFVHEWRKITENLRKTMETEVWKPRDAKMGALIRRVKIETLTRLRDLGALKPEDFEQEKQKLEAMTAEELVNMTVAESEAARIKEWKQG